MFALQLVRGTSAVPNTTLALKVMLSKVALVSSLPMRSPQVYLPLPIHERIISGSDDNTVKRGVVATICTESLSDIMSSM